MVYSKALERDVTTIAMAKAILRLYSVIAHDRVDFFTSEGRIRAVMYMYMLCVKAKTGKTSAYFLCFDIKLKKSRSGFNLVTVLI